MIEKITALAGSHRAEVPERNMICFNTRRHGNEKILYTVDALEDVVLEFDRRLIGLVYDKFGTNMNPPLNERSQQLPDYDPFRLQMLLSTKEVS